MYKKISDLPNNGAIFSLSEEQKEAVIENLGKNNRVHIRKNIREFRNISWSPVSSSSGNTYIDIRGVKSTKVLVPIYEFSKYFKEDIDEPLMIF